jgi:hypothetical protein
MADEHFNSWFSGFSDGEGHFGLKLARVSPRPSWGASFEIGLRADDAAILERVQRIFGGTLRHKTGRGGNQHEQIVWRVYAAPDLMRLVAHFRQYPLLAKKRRDFDVWALAVEHIAEHKSPRLSGRRVITNTIDHAYMQGLSDALKGSRLFKSTGHIIPIRWVG